MPHMAESQDLESLRSDIAFELQTRGERFTRISETEPEDPELAELLKNDEFDGLESEDPVIAVVQRMTRLLTLSTVTNSRMMAEIGKSLGFDLRTLSDLAEKVAEQERDIEMLRRAIEDLRRRS